LKEKTLSYILTLDLKPEIYQQHILEKRFNISRQIYNSCLGELLKRYKIMQNDKEYQLVVKMMKSKERNDLFKQLNQKYKLDEYSLYEFIKSMQHYFNKNIDSMTAQKLATRAWKSFEKLMFHQAKQVNFKRFGEMNSIEGKVNRTGIRFKDNQLIWNKLNIKVNINKNDIFANVALQDRIKYCRIIRKEIRSRIKYYLQLILEGIPPTKIHKTTGEIKHYTKNGEVGLDIGISTLAIVSDNKVNLLEFCNGLDNLDKIKRKLQRKIDRSKRKTNPNKYNDNGTINMKNKDKWIFSNYYKKIRSQLKEIQRKIASKRKIEHEKLSNIILEQGNIIKVETMNYKGLQKTKFGKRLGLKAPSMFLTILNRKLKYQDKGLIKVNTWTVKASQYNPFDNTYIKKPLSQRWQILSNGTKIQRDIFSAWLIKNVKDDLQKVDKQKCLDNFDKFYSLYQIEENRLNQCSELISSMGF
jgi:hypothetical protein